MPARRAVTAAPTDAVDPTSSGRGAAPRSDRPDGAAPAALVAADDPAVLVLRQFRQVFNAVKAHFQQVEKTVGIGGSQVWALSIVRDQPGLGVGALARAMAIHQSTASNLVRALAERGYVEAAKDGDDRRAVQLRLLPAGARVLDNAPGPFAGLLPDALHALDRATLQRLQGDLGQLIVLLDADERGASIPLADL